MCKEVPGEPQHNNQLHSQRNHTLHRQLSSRSSFTFPRVGSSSVSPSQNELMPSPQNQQNRMNVLRLEHQRKHKQRNGFYPHDNEEEMYEQQIKLSVDGKAMVCLFLTDFKRTPVFGCYVCMYACNFLTNHI